MGNKKILSRRQRRFFTEKSIIFIIMFTFVLLIGFNTIKAYNCCIMTRFFGFNVTDPGNNVMAQGIIEIVIEGKKMYPMLEIIINGELSDYKFENNNQVTITVYNGDVVQMNGSMYKDKIKVGIRDMSTNVNNVLGNNNYITLRGDINTLAIIRI